MLKYNEGKLGSTADELPVLYLTSWPFRATNTENCYKLTNFTLRKIEQ